MKTLVIILLGVKLNYVSFPMKFEDCFDCFDIYFSWGTAWAQISSARMLFIKKSIDLFSILLLKLDGKKELKSNVTLA